VPCGLARTEGKKKKNGTLRLSEKRRLCSCKEEMSSVVEAAESSWGWDETEDGDIATASMTEAPTADGGGQNPAAEHQNLSFPWRNKTSQ
jgi:hypothetical protein